MRGEKREEAFLEIERERELLFFHKNLVFLDTGYCGIPLKIVFFVCVSANPVFIYRFHAQLELFQVRMFRIPELAMHRAFDPMEKDL